MYHIILVLHNWVRWVVIVLAVLAIGRAYLGWFGKKAYTETDRKAGMYFTSALDFQVLLGLILYFFFSPVGLQAFINGGLQQPQGVFFAILHEVLMIIGVGLAHMGSMLPRKVQEAAQKHPRAALFFTLSVVVILIGIPWTRPLFRWFG